MTDKEKSKELEKENAELKQIVNEQMASKIKKLKKVFRKLEFSDLKCP